MGIMDNKLHSESTGMATLSNSDVSDGKCLGRPPLENGHSAASPKYKRRKVFAVRDFPPECGRLSLQIISTTVNEADCSVTFEDSVIGEDVVLSGSSAGVDVDEAGPGVRETIVSSDQAQVSKSIDVDEAGPGVGETIVSSDQAQVSKSIDVDETGPGVGETIVSSDQAQVSKSIDVDDAGPGVGETMVSSDQAQVSKSINLKHSGMPFSDGLVAFKDEGIVESAPPLEHQPVVELSDCPSEMLVTSTHEKTNFCKYPPRRRISAVRDFPPFCGRNAPLLEVGSTEGAACTESKSSELDKSGIEFEPTEGTMGTHFVQVQDLVQNGGAQPLSLGSCLSTHITDEVQTEVDDPGSRENKIQDESEASSDNVVKRSQDESQHQVGCLLEDIQQKYGLNTDEDQQSCSSYTPSPNQYHSNEAGDCMEENYNKAVPFVSECKTQASHEDSACLNFTSDRAVIVGLRAVGNGPARKGVADHKPKKVLGDMAATKGRRNNLSQKPYNTALDDAGKVQRSNSKSRDQLSSTSRKNQFAVNAGESSVRRMPSHTGKACQGIEQMAVLSQDDYQEHGGENDKFLLVRRATSSVNLPPRPASLVGKADNNESVASRSKVRETLRLFHAICRKLLQAKESKQINAPKRIDLHAAGMLKGKFVNLEKVIGSVPGVEVGDEFQYRIELNIIGLHRQIQGGIAYVNQGKKILCSSIVASGGYDDNMDDSDVLVYTGQGGNIMGGDKQQPEDQKLVKGNLALKNSAEEKNPVRVIRGDTKVSDDGKAKTYIYDGLYEVEKWWQEMGQHGKLVFKFKLVRRPGQAPLAWKVVKKSKKFKVREGLCAEDISKGKEVIPICAVNTVDDDKPPVFHYITRTIYPDCVDLIPPVGCGCIDGCSDNRKCTCVAKNGGEIPYNHNGAIVEAKPLVYECGPSCNCPPSCHNRVSQNGIRFQLEIFKTESRGWGVRSLNSIPSGSFICEYIGELLEEKEAEQRTGNDEYLFDIGNEYDGASLHNELSSLMPAKHASSHEVVEDGSFTIDAAQYGNIGRFINHSCSPNLYAQNVVYDHVDKRIPHIMFFAAENIPPLQELTYHYNYAIDQVRGSDGSIKRKDCFCGSVECTGRMY